MMITTINLLVMVTWSCMMVVGDDDLMMVGYGVSF